MPKEPTPEIISISDSLVGKTSTEMSSIKCDEILKEPLPTEYTDTRFPEVELEFVGDVSKIEVNGQYGVEVFAKAWHNGEQLGFGKDGSIEIERFRVFNPPLYVKDVNGTYVESYTNEQGEKVEVRYREAPMEALKQVVARVAQLHGRKGTKIEAGKVGNTTSTFNPSLNGLVGRITTDATWTACRDTADGSTVDQTSATIYHTSERRTDSGNVYQNGRIFYIYDTSAITDSDSIDSGFMEVEAQGDSTSISAWGLQEGTPADETNLVVGDYDALTVNSPTRCATDITPNGTAGVRNTWTLNAAGLAAVDKTGKTVFVLRAARDMDNSAPTARSYWSAKMLATAGTTDDPLLSITHSAGASGPSNLKSYNTNVKANIKSINTNPIANVKSLNTNT